jgi:hypothetical protein
LLKCGMWKFLVSQVPDSKNHNTILPVESKCWSSKCE